MAWKKRMRLDTRREAAHRGASGASMWYGKSYGFFFLSFLLQYHGRIHGRLGLVRLVRGNDQILSGNKPMTHPSIQPSNQPMGRRTDGPIRWSIQSRVHNKDTASVFFKAPHERCHQMEKWCMRRDIKRAVVVDVRTRFPRLSISSADIRSKSIKVIFPLDGALI